MDIMTASRLLIKVKRLMTKRAIPNKVTNHAAPITWSSKKIERVGNSSLDAQTFGVTKLISHPVLHQEDLQTDVRHKDGRYSLCLLLILKIYTRLFIILTISRTIQEGGKNLFATYFGHILVISSGVKSKRVPHIEALCKKMQKFLKLAE